MDDLIKRLEKATEGSRLLDAAIAVAMFDSLKTEPQEGEKYSDLVYAKSVKIDDNCAPGTFWIKSRSGFSLRSAPHYTTSEDAARTLLPNDPSCLGGMLWSLSYDEDGIGGSRSFCAGIGKGYHDPQYIYGHSKYSPAIAFCIAVLKVHRAASAPSPSQ